MILRLIVIALVGLCAYAAGYSRERFCPPVGGAEYRESEQNGEKLICRYAVTVKRTMVRGLTKEERTSQGEKNE